MSNIADLTSLLGRHPKHAAVELNTLHGISAQDIADKLEVSLAQVAEWLGLSRAPAVTMSDVARRHAERAELSKTNRHLSKQPWHKFVESQIETT